MKQYSAFLTLVFVLVFGGALLCTSCKSSSVPIQETTETTNLLKITEKEHDSLFKIPADQSQYSATVKIVDGKPVLVEPKVIKSQNGSLNPPKVNLKDNQLTCDCDLKEQELHAKWKSENRQESITVVKKVPVLVPRDLSFWQELQIWAGRILFFLLILFIIGRYIKSFNPLK
ncbi:hypothetical protein FNO01nite_30470 [Flavobacterium noncentrifugens]|uniref:Uncharacterized protein n=1 Tax=Flavobacterium noncentrifugens TaxID=1128970 RepID=A0A1G9BVH8_9FLAO|nr:hypothetical protein [Flavobacterium noncentrifugens]GEP52375.1 hypothetical protein FNO01nite_30470 [Flavobacterium noncentrifugens]SDK43164.1 hypothetical protein SAMN04487935_3360 [Flavobacterium noncentrifugens]